MKQIKVLIISLFALVGLLSPVTVKPVGAVDVFRNCTGNVICDETKGGEAKVSSLFKTVVNVFLFILGALSVIMIVIGGIRYTTSGGNAAAVTGAKNTILYAVVGLVIALFAYAIVNFVITSFK